MRFLSAVRKFGKCLACAVALCGWALGSHANANNIAVVNPSFETGDLTGWTATGAAGAQNLNGSYTPVAPAGIYNAYLNGPCCGGPSSISQDLTSAGSTVAAGISYTLSVEVGDNVAFTTLPNFSISLYDVSTGLTLSNLNGTALTTSTAPFNAYLTFTATYSALASGDPSLGDHIGIRLTDNTNVQSLLDNVQLHATPEPSALVLFGLGAVGLFVAARRRQRV